MTASTMDELRDKVAEYENKVARLELMGDALRAASEAVDLRRAP